MLGAASIVLAPTLNLTPNPPQGQDAPTFALMPPAALIAVSTGSGKITLYWDGVHRATGYNVYRSTVAGGQNYASPVNGSVPVNTVSYPGGATFTYTDTGLTNGTTYYYTVKTLVGSTPSWPSPEDSDFPDPASVPWDSANPAAILAALEALSPEPFPSGAHVRSMGPDGSIYETGAGLQLPPDATHSEYSNTWI